MTDLATVTDIRTRKVPVWNPDTRRHAREDTAGALCPTCEATPEEEHRCLHCGIVLHSAEEGASDWVQHFAAPHPDGTVKRGRMASRGKCPGPRRHLTLVASVEGGSEPPSVPPLLAADEGAVPPAVSVVAARAPLEVADLPSCTRCVPPCGRTGHPTLGGPTCDEGLAVVAGKRAAHLRELRDATSGMGVPTWRGGAA